MATKNRQRMPLAGDIVRVTQAASVQFRTNPIWFRVIRTHDWTTYDGWVWLDGYELDGAGDAKERRTIWVQPAGLEWVKIEVRRGTRLPPLRRPDDPVEPF